MAEDDKTEETENTTKYMTAEEANKFYTAREKRLEERMGKMLEDRMAKVLEQIKPTAEAPKPTGGPADEVKAQMAEMQNRLKAAEAEREREKQAREQERAERMRSEERAALADALRSAGVGDKQVKPAVAMLFTEEGRVKRDDTGAIKFRVQKDGYEDLVDLETAVKEWVKTEEGKIFLPARQVGGSGTKPSGVPGHNGKGVSPDELKAQLLDNVRKMMGG